MSVFTSALSLSSHLSFPQDYETPTHSETEADEAHSTRSSTVRSAAHRRGRCASRDGSSTSNPPVPPMPDPAPVKPMAISPSAPLGGLFPSQHVVTIGRFATSADPRGYIPVYEYSIDGHAILLDSENGMVHFTGIYKALGGKKLEGLDADLADSTRKIRGGSLKIQGTWLTYEVALSLARRVAWKIRHDLIPLFGPDFPSSCLTPGEKGYGELGTTPKKEGVSTNPFPSVMGSTKSAKAKVTTRSWKWNQKGGVERSSLSMRGQLHFEAVATRSVTQSAVSISPRLLAHHLPTTRHSPYAIPIPPLSPLISKNRPTAISGIPPMLPSPHIYAATSSLHSTEPTDINIIDPPYYRSIARADYQLPLSTPTMASSNSGSPSSSQFRPSAGSSMTSGYVFPSRNLPDPQSMVDDGPLLYGPGPFSSPSATHRKENEMMSGDKGDRRPTLPSIRIEMGAQDLRRSSSRNDHRIEEANDTKGSPMTSSNDRLLPPIWSPFAIQQSLPAIFTSSVPSAVRDTADLARRILSSQPEYRQTQSYRAFDRTQPSYGPIALNNPFNHRQPIDRYVVETDLHPPFLSTSTPSSSPGTPQFPRLRDSVEYPSSQTRVEM